MTVKQLIAALNHFPLDMPVGFSGETDYVNLVMDLQRNTPPFVFDEATEKYVPNKQEVLFIGIADESKYSWHEG